MDYGANISLLKMGGPVMYVLFAVSLFGFIVFIERTLFLHKGQIRTNQFLDGIKNLVRKRRFVEAITVCEETPGPVAGVVKAALLHHHEGEDKMRFSVQAAALVEIPILERRIGTLAALARIGPLIGLLGTVLGVAMVFINLQASETAAYPDFGQFMSGLGQALLTTLGGFIIAIMAHLAHHFLYGRVRALVHDMEFAGHAIMQYLLYDLPDNEEPLLGREGSPVSGDREHAQETSN